MFANLVSFLNQPYPEHAGFAEILKSSIISAIIVFLFLAVFQPFQLDSLGSDAIKFSFYFGLITFATSLIFECIISFVFKITRTGPSWTFWKWLIMVLALVICIAISNYVFMMIALDRSFQIFQFMGMLQATLAVGIFPCFIIGSITLIRNTKVNQKIADSIDAELIQNDSSSDHATSVNVSLPIKNSTKTFDLDPQRILFIEAMQNYVQIHMLEAEGRVKKEMHRNTISTLEEVLLSHEIKRCHRSYLVNPHMIKEITGNAQGLKIAMKHGEEIVPVSRKYISIFK